MIDKKLEKRIIDLSHLTEENAAIPLIIEYATLYSDRYMDNGFIKDEAKEFAITFLEDKYNPKVKHKKCPTIDYDDVCLVNCNIQRYR